MIPFWGFLTVIRGDLIVFFLNNANFTDQIGFHPKKGGTRNKLHFWTKFLASLFYHLLLDKQRGGICLYNCSECLGQFGSYPCVDPELLGCAPETLATADTDLFELSGDGDFRRSRIIPLKAEISNFALRATRDPQLHYA
ncbi:hypothetical protein COT49_03525 [candidate division WWE3 bacterium CG08_land_8_20_14_0_20_40_13]|uniref:Uncharacterized protein n=1 Tax=candidate division WWE3 bacterium CG08_land_8_20_14_0_20_40_13 TaxID=1975084 RepID=A0A2H0XCY8_UNCKA|nr:MAG: hypothetical protein COT49_03525 [candidate division WWE3 bacterium CG08_land_8_20_14_0_20_40_13]